MKKLFTAVALAVTTLTAAAEPVADRPVQAEVRQYACGDVTKFTADACLDSMLYEVERAQKNYLKNPSLETSYAFDLAVGVLSGALAVAPKSTAKTALEGRYKALLLEVAGAQGKTLPSFVSVN